MNRIKTKLYITLSSFLFATPVLAQDSLPQIINNLYETSLGLGALAAVVVVTIGGIYWSISGAVDKKAEAKKYITSAILGLVLLFGAFILFETINPEITTLDAPDAETYQGSGSSGGPGTGSLCGQQRLEKCQTEWVATSDLIDEHGQDHNGDGVKEIQRDNIPRCNQAYNCSDGIQEWQEVLFEEGDKAWTHLFYTSNGGPAGKQYCVIYKWKNNGKTTNKMEQWSNYGLQDC